MALFRRIDEFKSENEQWSAYIERMEQFFEANDEGEEKQLATLLSVMSAATYGLLRNLVQPRNPKDKTFDEIVAILKEHYEPKPLLVAEMFVHRTSLCPMGDQSHCTLQDEKSCVKRDSLWTPRHSENKGLSSQVNMYGGRTLTWRWNRLTRNVRHASWIKRCHARFNYTPGSSRVSPGIDYT